MILFGIDLPDGLGRVGVPDNEWHGALHPDERGFAETLTQEIARLDQREVEYRIPAAGWQGLLAERLYLGP